MAPTIFALNLSYFRSMTAKLKIVELIFSVIAVGTTTYATLTFSYGAINPIMYPSILTHVVLNCTFFITVLFLLTCYVLSKPVHDGINGTIVESAWNGMFAIMFFATSIAVMKSMADAIKPLNEIQNYINPSSTSKVVESLKVPYVLHLAGAVFSFLNSLVLALHTYLNAKELMSGESNPV